MYMSFGPNQLLKKEFIKYVLENNTFERANIVILKKVNTITGDNKYYNSIDKISGTQAEKMLKKVKPNELSDKVKMLKKKNRHLRHFNAKFKETLATGIRWENAVNDVESMSKSMSQMIAKGKKKKSLGKRKRKGKRKGLSRTFKKGGRRRKTRRKTKRRRR